MSYKIVAHPETGRPAKEEKNYTEIELSHLEAEVAQAEQELTNAQNAKTEHDARSEELAVNVAKAQEVLADKKSNVESYHEIAAVPESDTGAETTSSEGENANEGGEVTVPVQVEEPQF